MNDFTELGIGVVDTFGLPAVCGWFMFRLERILTKLTSAVEKCPHNN